MGQQSGATTVIVIDTETTYKTNPVSPDGMVLPFKPPETLALKRPFTASATIRNSRNPQKPGRGRTDVAGDIPFELAPEQGRLFKHIFGGYAKTGSTAPYTHTYTIGSLPVGMVVEKQFLELATPKYYVYNGCRVNSFKLAAKTEGPIDCGVSLMGAKETRNTSAYDATSTDLGFTPFDGMDGAITVAGSPVANIAQIDFAIDENLDGNSYAIGGNGERRALPAGTVAVNGNIEALFEDEVLYDLAIANTETALTLAFSRGDGLGGSAGNDKMTFYFDELKLSPESPAIQGPQGLLVKLPFSAYYENASVASACRMILLSPLSTF